MIRKKENASVTVEAACVFPIFLFSILAFYYMILMLGIQTEVYSALTDTANEASLYGYYQEKDFDWAAAFYTNLDSKIIKNPCIRFHLISLSNSYYDKDDIYLYADYGLALPVPFFGHKTIKKQEVVHSRKFIGWDRRTDGDRAGGKGERDEVWVYITETGKVYHRSLDCSHLSLSVRLISAKEVPALRNEDGGKYYACEKCGRGEVLAGNIYITKEGNRYHFSGNCPGLKRSVRKILLTEVGNRRACSRCGS